MLKAFSSLRRVALGGAAIGVGVLLIGAAWKAYGGFGGEGPGSAPGRMVDLGGFRLHLQCEGSGGPAVVFESGAGEDAAFWRKMQPRVAQFTRMCAYDRAGIGFSDAAVTARDSRHIVSELHRLLDAANEKGPYVLVTHSAGALHARVYADRYRNEVVGLVLVEPAAETGGKIATADGAAEEVPDSHPALETLHTIWHGGKESATSCREMVSLDDDVREAANVRLRADLPIVVLRGGDPADVSNAVRSVIARLR